MNKNSQIGHYYVPVLECVGADDWSLESFPIDRDTTAAVRANWRDNAPTLAFVKDGEFHSLRVFSGGRQMTFAEFSERIGLRLSTKKGYFVAGKRISRMLRPVPFWAWKSFDIGVIRMPGSFTDGLSYARRSVVDQFNSNWDANHPDRVDATLRGGWMFFLTIVCPLGEHKSRMVVLPDDEFEKSFGSKDIMIGASDLEGLVPDFKKELAADFDGRTLYTLETCHNSETHDMDVQSLSNVSEPIGPFPMDLWIRWAQEDAINYVDDIVSGRMWNQLSKLSSLDSYDISQMQKRAAEGKPEVWPVKAMALGRGKPYPRMVRQLLDMYLERQVRGTKHFDDGHDAHAFRVPNLAGGAYYVTPRNDVPRGHVRISEKYGLTVNWMDLVTLDQTIDMEKWLSNVKAGVKMAPGIYATASGGDGDDKFWFIVVRWNNEYWVVMARNPNGTIRDEGAMCSVEVMWLRLSGSCPEKWLANAPEIDLDKMPHEKITVGNPVEIPCVDNWLDPKTLKRVSMDSYTLEGVIRASGDYPGPMLGSVAQLAMVWQITNGSLMPQMPAGISQLVDRTNCKFRFSKEADEEIWKFVKNAQEVLVQNFQIPYLAIERVPQRLHYRMKVNEDASHPWNRLWNGVKAVRKAMSEAIDGIVGEVVPPETPFSKYYLPEAKEIMAMSAEFWAQHRQDPGQPREKISEFAMIPLKRKVAEFLDKFDVDEQLLIALSVARMAYRKGRTDNGVVSFPDSILFMPGLPYYNGKVVENHLDLAKPGVVRKRGLAEILIDALRASGAIGIPVWSKEERKPMLHWGQYLSAPNRMGIAVNGLRYTYKNRIIATLKDLVPENEINDQAIDVYIKMYVEMERDSFIRSGSCQMFPDNLIGIKEELWRNKPGLAAMTMANDKPFRMGGVAIRDGYEIAPGVYRVKDFYYKSNQLMVILQLDNPLEEVPVGENFGE